MPRRNFSAEVPDNPDALMGLANRILQKHYQDGGTSILPSMLMEQLQVKLDIARTENERQNELTRRKEKLTEERSLLLGLGRGQGTYTPGTLLYYVLAARDILLGLYLGRERALGDWGYEVNSNTGSVQVVVPTNAEKLIALVKKVMQKHYNDGTESPLHSLNWDAINTKLNEAEMKLEEGRQINRDKEKATQNRNIALGIDRGQHSKTAETVKSIVKAVRKILLGHFRGSEQTLGDWGFEVNFSTTPEPTTPTKKDDPIVTGS